MAVVPNAVLLRLFMGESDRSGHQPLYEAVVLKARELGLAGATVLRGPLGFGHSSILHSAKILRLSENLPMVVEIVDTEAKVRTLVAALEPLLAAESTLVTVEHVEVIRYGRENRASFG